MRTGKVIVLAISGRRNKIHKLNDIVKEDQFVAGRFQELLDGGYIQVVAEDNKPVVFPDAESVEIKSKPIDDKPLGIKQAEERMKSTKVEAQEKSAPKQPVKQNDGGDKVHREMMEKLDALKVPYNKNASKQELYELIKKAEKK